MIPQEKVNKLIKLYTYICDLYNSELKYHCQRFSNNSRPIFTDQEILTIYLFCGDSQRYFTIKEIHTFAKEYMHSWFPKLPSYQTFNKRLNRMCDAITILVNRLIDSFKPTECDSVNSLLDSMPIITCAGKNKTGKVATELAKKGFCSTKNLYYYGIKLHALAARVANKIPFPEMLVLSSAADNDLTVFKHECADHINNKVIFADKIYSDKNYFSDKNIKQNLFMLTPVKAIKDQINELKQRDKAANDLYSTAVSRIRQPIESFFNWLNEKTNIQRAIKVRSTSGLIVHTMGKIAIAFIYLIFKQESEKFNC